MRLEITFKYVKRPNWRVNIARASFPKRHLWYIKTAFARKTLWPAADARLVSNGNIKTFMIALDICKINRKQCKNKSKPLSETTRKKTIKLTKCPKLLVVKFWIWLQNLMNFQHNFLNKEWSLIIWRVQRKIGVRRLKEKEKIQAAMIFTNKVIKNFEIKKIN